MFDQKNIFPRQIHSQTSKFTQNYLKMPEMPFILHRQTYKQLNPYQKRGHWSEKQKLKYAVFVQYFKKRFQIKAKRRFNNIFDLMSVFIKTRNSHQCRSHHQKMQKQKFKVDSILIATASKYHPRVYQQLKERYMHQIELLDIDEEQNFQKFRERIEKIQIKKNLQRQQMANNKRILRSSKYGETKKNKFQKKLKQGKRISIPLKQNQQHFHRQINEDGIKMRVKRQQQEDKQKQKIERIQHENKNKSIESREEINLYPLCFNPVNLIQNVQISYYDRMQILQINKKQHLDMAFYHYNEYIKHINQANNIQFQIMKQNSLKGVNSI